MVLYKVGNTKPLQMYWYHNVGGKGGQDSLVVRVLDS